VCPPEPSVHLIDRERLDLRSRIGREPNPAPLTWRQLAALAAAIGRQLGWGLRGVARETRNWRARAALIPDAETRADALGAIVHKRGNIDGAALFWILPRSRNHRLLRLLVAYQIMWDFLDDASERGAGAGLANGMQLHLALVDGLDWQSAVHDHYRLHPWSQDGGYLSALVHASRDLCQGMPGYRAVQEPILRDAQRASVQAINHDPEPNRRRAILRVWVGRRQAESHDLPWFEFSGAASAALSIYALLALGYESADAGTFARVYEAYFPWISAVTTMLDSYADEARDRALGKHVYVAHYRTRALAAASIARLVRCAFAATHGLPRGERHRVIVASMVALHLSHDGARTAALRPSTVEFIRAGGSLTRLLVPVLRLWRIAYSQRST
jgi:tetraprenyl-beta-curcumene synthase